jgi:hypothetical protein
LFYDYLNIKFKLLRKIFYSTMADCIKTVAEENVVLQETLNRSRVLQDALRRSRSYLGHGGYGHGYGGYGHGYGYPYGLAGSYAGHGVHGYSGYYPGYSGVYGATCV